jgi:hypothetical protein
VYKLLEINSLIGCGPGKGQSIAGQIGRATLLQSPRRAARIGLIQGGYGTVMVHSKACMTANRS